MADGSPATTMDLWLSAAQLVGLAGLPTTERGIRLLAERDSWESRPKRFGKGREYAFASLPHETRAAIALKSAAPIAVPEPKPEAVTGCEITARWAHFESLSDSRKQAARKKLNALTAVAMLVDGGLGKEAARAIVAAQSTDRGVSVVSLRRWAREVGDAPRSDWLALLADDYVGRKKTADCDAVCWDWYLAHYLTRKAPSHASTYRRVEEMAKAQGWTIPAAITFVRRIDAQYSRVTQVLMREGPEAAARLLPARDRDALVFGCGQAINGDGLKFDKLWVRFEDGEVLNTTTGWFWQDIHSRRILAWRVDKTESTDLFRLATYDLTGICAPELVYVDNTRVAANKVMTAGATNRHRFKAEPEDGLGLLMMLGMTPRFTNPDKETGNPGSKPIERAFGIGGIHSEVATHPRFANRGYNRETAIAITELREVVAEEVARFNARPKRDTQACRRLLSFNDAWAAGLAQRPPRVLADAQRRLLLMSREIVTVANDGLITINAGRSDHGKNRYWHERSVELHGQKVAVHFDPENLSADVHVYSMDGRYLVSAQHRASAAFNDTASGRDDAKWKRAQIKLRKKEAALAVRRSALENAQLYDAARPKTPPPAAAAPTVVAGHFQSVIDPARDAQRPPLQGEAQVIPMKRTGTDDAGRNAQLDELLKQHQQKQIQESGWTPPTRDE